MAFDQDYFSSSGAQSSRSPAVFTYFTDDALQTVVSSGYFVDKALQLKKGDSIIAYTADGAKILTVTTSTDTATEAIVPPSADTVVIVKTGSQLTGDIDSGKTYFLDGIIDMTGLGSITVPASGISIVGYDFDVSQLISSSDSHVMFTGSGSIKAKDVSLSVTGSSASMYDLTAATGNEFIEMIRVNYNGCTSLGEITNYRQGFETGTGRFGGNPSLTLSGSWNGYRITESIVRSLDDTISTPLFSAGSGLVFSSRFITDVNADLGALAAFTDFSDANFSLPSLFQIKDASFSRNGVFDATDTTINTAINAENISSDWSGNNGISNTFEGGRLDITASQATALSGEAAGDFLDLAGTYVASDLQHFDSPANGQLRNLGNTPREFSFYSNMKINGTSGDALNLKVVQWDSSESIFVDTAVQQRTVVNLAGNPDSAFFNMSGNLHLDINDYIKLMVSNDTAARDVTVDASAYFVLQDR